MDFSKAIKKIKDFIPNRKKYDDQAMTHSIETDPDKMNIAEEDKINLSKDKGKIINTSPKEQESTKEDSNKREKNKKTKNEKNIVQENDSMESNMSLPNYDELINKYKQEIKNKPQSSLNNKRNLLAFAYYKSGRIDEARKELISLIEENDSYVAYRQLIHLEKSEGNFDDAKLWAYEGIEKFPDSIHIRQLLLSIAKEEKDFSEVDNLKKEISRVEDKRLKTIPDER